MTNDRIFSRLRLAASLFLISLALPVSGCALTGSDPPSVPHATAAAFEQCRSCHATGEQGAPITDHLKRVDCLECHKPLGNGGQ